MDVDAGAVVEWRPGGAAAVLWNLAAVPLLLGGFVLYFWLASLQAGPGFGRIAVGPAALLLAVLETVAVTALLLAAHEGVHGLVMAGFGGRPRYGALLIAGVLPALYTTAPGHRFSRARYLAVALSPAVAISSVGAAACLTPMAGYLVVPLAIHLSGCVGDFAASLRLLGEPPGTLCEDLKDGIRFHRPP